MGPAELAGLVAREAEAGVAAALAATDAAGVLVLERVVGRVGTRPPRASGDQPDDDPPWQAEFHLRHDPRAGLAATDIGEVPARLAALPVRALRGVGPAWAERFAGHGIRSVGELAAASPTTVTAWTRTDGRAVLALVARARACTGEWPPVDRHDARSALVVATTDPADLEGVPPGSRADAVALWGHCLRLAAALDDDVLAGIPVNGG